MKREKGFLTTFIAFICIYWVTCTLPQKAFAQAEPVNFQVFYDNLSPFGQWVNYQNYGYVWLPDAPPGFRPYATNGYWANTEYGWMWMSDFQWGWAAFHYGRWSRDPYLGWFWVPGYQWGPAWVSWRQSPGYYGWAPMTPGIEVNMAIGGSYNPEPDYWVFANDRYMGNPYIYNYYAPQTETVVIINRSSYIRESYTDRERGNVVYVYGPRTEDVQRTSGATVERVTIVQRSEPGYARTGNQLSIYRPVVAERNSPNREAPHPSRVEEVRNVPTLEQRNQNYQRNHTVEQNPHAVQPEQQRDREPQKNIQEQAPQRPQPEQRSTESPQRPAPQQEPQRVQPQPNADRTAPQNSTPANPPKQNNRRQRSTPRPQKNNNNNKQNQQNSH